MQKGLSHDLHLWPGFSRREDTRWRKRCSKSRNVKGRADWVRATRTHAFSQSHPQGCGRGAQERGTQLLKKTPERFPDLISGSKLTQTASERTRSLAFPSPFGIFKTPIFLIHWSKVASLGPRPGSPPLLCVYRPHVSPRMWHACSRRGSSNI